MKNYFLLPLFLIIPFFLPAQQLDSLTVNKIMQDPSWIGTSPSQPFWSPNGEKLYFSWNPEKATSDSLYYITLNNHNPQKATLSEQETAIAQRSGSYNASKDQIVYSLNNTLYLLDIPSGQKKSLFKTTFNCSHLNFGNDKIFFQMQSNLYTYHLSTGMLEQITNFKNRKKPNHHEHLSAREKFLEEDALENSSILKRRKKEKEEHKKHAKVLQSHSPMPIYIGNKVLNNITVDPNGHYITYRLHKNRSNKNTKIPHYVTNSGYISESNSRPKVGIHLSNYTSYIFDTEKDTTYPISIQQIPGIRDIPSFYKNYPDVYDSLRKNPPLRKVVINGPIWNNTGTKAVVVIRSLDHKDRWIMSLNPKNGDLQILNRQHDNAWIGGPGIGYTYGTGNIGWIDEQHIWFQSEKTGYSHLYTQNLKSGKIKALTHGKYEVQDATLSPDKKNFYITANKTAPGQKQFYHLNIKTGQLTRITEQKGGNKVTVSPNGQNIAFLHSTAIHPWELYLQKNSKNTQATQITQQAESKLYQSYPWRDPKTFTFKDRDGLKVHAKVYKPEKQAASRPGVIFVHGAGYLQDVKDSWSYYFREHMFMNMLVDQGYTVMNIDYRGSAGYGRDWRTAIYRHMGENDLEDIVDGTKYMVEQFNVNPNKVGIWGGSYGGFMTLMALFKTDVFACGAALRSVTDWAHYNHGYTSNILNLPQNDSIAYVQSSPIYFAEGLENPLLMCHGMIDPNVHFQDIVRLTEKLIELKKNDWELAVYPLEGHGFIEPESWRDEYYRIYQLFEKNLK